MEELTQQTAAANEEQSETLKTAAVLVSNGSSVIIEEKPRSAASVKLVAEDNNNQQASKPEEKKDDDPWLSLQPKFFGAEDMPEDMKKVAVDVARNALKKKTNKERAEMIKKHFDKTFVPASAAGKWHCIVGTDFGSYVTHESQTFLFFQLGAYFVLIFKA